MNVLRPRQPPAFSLPGTAWRSGDGLWIAEFSPAVRWAVATGARFGSPCPDDGAAALLAEAAGKPESGAATRLVVTAGTGCAGLGSLSTSAANGFAHAAAERFCSARTNLLFAAAGLVLAHFPVGEALARLERAMGEPAASAPAGAGADSLRMGLMLDEGPVAVSAARFAAPAGFGGEVWVAGIGMDVGRAVLDDLAGRLWTAGPEALRARTGPVPGDVLIVLSAAPKGGAEALVAWDDPRREPAEAALAAALGGLARRDARARGLRPCLLAEADTPEEAARTARRIAPALSAMAAELDRMPAGDRPGAVGGFLRAALLTAGLVGFERTPVRAELGGLKLYEGARPIVSSSDVAAAVGTWLSGGCELAVGLGRGRFGMRFWV